MPQAKPRPLTRAQFDRRHDNEIVVGIALDRETCDWVIDAEADTAICRTHGEVCDGVRSAHFPGSQHGNT